MDTLKEKYQILIAEDDNMARKILNNTLIKAGYGVVTATNGREALMLHEKYFCPIVITDWMMPEMNGPELCLAIRKQSSSRYVYVIMLTSRESKKDLVEGINAGADDYLTKPFNHGELFARINTAHRILALEASLLKANEEIRKLSISDPLTGCFNRGYLMSQIPQEIKRASRYCKTFTLTMWDIDLFKKVNDTHGHQVGDLVLKSFVRLFKENIRDDLDWIARYGGEEFLLFLPETGLQEARVISERLRKLIEKSDPCEGLLSITSSYGGVTVKCSPSFSPEGPEALINRADSLLYDSKRRGRNCGEITLYIP